MTAPNDIDRATGRRLREVRLALGLGMEEVKAGVAWQQIWKYENGKNRVSVGRLYELAKFYRVPVSTLLPEEEAGTYLRPYDRETLTVFKLLAGLSEFERGAIIKTVKAMAGAGSR